MLNTTCLRTVAGAAVVMLMHIAPVQAQSSTVPFTKLLCLSSLGTCTTGLPNGVTPALPSSFTVPAAIGAGLRVKQLTIDFVSGDCIGTARTTEIFIYGFLGALNVGAKGDNFSSNRIPMSVAQFNDTLNANAVQSFAMRTVLVYRPNTTIAMSFDFAKAGNMVCKLQLNGQYVTN